MEQFTATSPNFAQVSLPAPQARKFVLSRWRRRRCLNQGQRCGYPPGDYYKFEDRCHFAVSENTPNVPMCERSGLRFQSSGSAASMRATTGSSTGLELNTSGPLTKRHGSAQAVMMAVVVSSSVVVLVGRRSMSSQWSSER